MRRTRMNNVLKLMLNSPLQAQNPKIFTPLNNSYSTKPRKLENNNQHAPSQKPNRDSTILENFKHRKLKGSSLNTPIQQSQEEEEEEDVEENNMQVVLSGFEQLGLSKEVVDAVGEMGVFVPSEIQCVGIPAVLDGKSLVLSSSSGSGRTLAYLLPLFQLLRSDEGRSRMKPNQPRAIVLCSTLEKADQVFRVAKFISHSAQSKSVKGSSSDTIAPQEVSTEVPIGMAVGTPSEVLEYIEDEDIVVTDIKFMVLDEADAMFSLGLAPEIEKILTHIKSNKSQDDKCGPQAVMVTSTMSELLSKHNSSFVERLERDNAGKVSAMFLEIDPSEAFHIIRCPDALTRKVAEALQSLHSPAS